MNDLGPFGLLAIAVGVAAVFVLVGAIPVLLARNLITRRPATTHLREWPLYVFSAALMIFVFVGVRNYYASAGLSVPFCTYSLYRHIPIFKCLVNAVPSM